MYPWWPFGTGEINPYSNFHDLNQDWIIKTVKVMKDFFDNQLDPLIEQKVQEVALNLVLSYDPDTETLIMRIGDEGHG